MWRHHQVQRSTLSFNQTPLVRQPRPSQHSGSSTNRAGSSSQAHQTNLSSNAAARGASPSPTSDAPGDRASSRERKPSGSGDGGKGGSGGDDGEQNRVYKAISRVHRACTSCRKQKARCDGPEDPPCRRCKAAGIDCIFEKPPRDSAAVPESGAERIKSLETQMSDMQSMIGELVNTIKNNTRLLAQVHGGPGSGSGDGSPAPSRPPYAGHESSANPHQSAGLYRQPSYSHTLQRVPSYTPRAQDLLQQPTTAQHSQYLQDGGDLSPSARTDPDRRVYPWSAPSPRLGSGLSNISPTGGEERSPTTSSWRQNGNQPGGRGPSGTHRPEHLHSVAQPWAYPASHSASDGSKGIEVASATSSTPEGSSQPPVWRQATPQRTSMLPPPSVPRSGSRDAEGEADIPNDQLRAPIEALRGLADAAAAAAAADRIGAEGGGADQDGPAVSEASPSNRQYPGDEFLVNKDTPNGVNTATTGAAGSQANSSARTRRLPSESSDAPAVEDARAPFKRRRIDTRSSSAKGDVPLLDDFPPSGVDRPGDLVTLGYVTEDDAKRLFTIFGQGVPKFISIFHFEDHFFRDSRSDAMESIRVRSYFLFNVILAIGALIECGGGPKSQLYHTCMAQAKRNAKDTLFTPVDGKEAVQAMVLLGSYSDNGWLPTGMSIRMAQELGLDRSFQRLMNRLPPGSYLRQPPPPHPPRNSIYHQGSPASLYTESPTERSDVSGPVLRRDEGDGKTEPLQGSIEELRELARGARLWFFLFLFDHQASFGAGRPAMLSKHYVRNCRAFLTLQYPLAVDTDARFISTLELLIIRETHYDAMGPYDQPVDARMLARMRKVTHELDEWHKYWSSELSARGYDESSFFQQSLILQCASAELYLTCTALRGIKDSNDADRMGPEQKELIIQATRAADTCLSISVNSDEYREMLGWAPHYTHVTAAFACVFLIKIARLFPRQVDTYGIFSNAEKLATRLAEVPATKYSRVIRILLAQAWKKILDLSPSIGLYAALGVEGSRPGAITPAEIKMGGPSDSGLSLLYKLLQEHQQGEQQPAGHDGSGDVAASNVGASGSKLSEIDGGAAKWNTSSAPSPMIASAMTPSRVAASFSAAAGAGYRHALEGESPRLPWNTDTPTANLTHQPLQLPLWMQESTGSLMDSGNQLRDWATSVDAYGVDGQGGGGGGGGAQGEGVGTALNGQMGLTPSSHAGLPQGTTSMTASNFDSVLTDLGLPMDGLDVLFFDHLTAADAPPSVN
ncbi:hypothetical protein ACQY0O_002202 [Thecaphora frezii]